MRITQWAALVWIAGWALTVWVFLQARRRYAEVERQRRDSEIVLILDRLSSNPPAALVLILFLWPGFLVSFTAMTILPWAEKKMDEAEDEYNRDGRED